MNQPSAALLVVSRFRVSTADRAAFLVDLAAAMDVLAEQPGCLGLSLGQATDDEELVLLAGEWDGVGAYRRALSAFDVKVNAVPLLSRAVDEPSAFEVVRHRDATGLRIAPSGLAADAGSVGLGEAAGASVPPVSS